VVSTDISNLPFLTAGKGAEATWVSQGMACWRPCLYQQKAGRLYRWRSHRSARTHEVSFGYSFGPSIPHERATQSRRGRRNQLSLHSEEAAFKTTSTSSHQGGDASMPPEGDLSSNLHGGRCHPHACLYVPVSSDVEDCLRITYSLLDTSIAR
jgi:hypothetical protein